MRKVVISSPVATQSGYGHHAREVIKQFMDKKKDEWDINLLSMPWGNTPFTYPIPTEWRQKFIGLPLQTKPDIWVQITVPNEFQAVGQYNIGVTAGTEGSICNPEWIDKINQMQITIVPSKFTKKTFEDTATKHGKTITTNLQVISEYFDDKIYDSNNVTTTVPALDTITEKEAFLMCGHWLQGQMGEDRKNISGALHCFFNTFKDKKNKPALVLKTSGATYSVTDRWEIENKINQIRDMFGADKKKLPNVYLLHGDLTNAEMNALYNHNKIKAMISFTKAEGFGRPLLEFATTGKPIIAPHYSGQADFLKKEFICALPGKMTNIHESAANDFLLKEAQWFTVDYGYAGKMLIDVLKNYKRWKQLATRQRYFVNSNFTVKSISEQYDLLLDLIDKGTDNIPKQIELKLPKLSLPNITKKKNPNLNDMAISDETLEWFNKNLPEGSTILEFGSGTGTIELTKKWKVYSVEQDEKYIGVAKDSNYIHAPIVNDWYDADIVFSKIPKEYDFILVDGPGGSHYRPGINKYWDKLNTNLPMIFDDTHRKSDRDHAIGVAKYLGKEWYEVKGWQKSFIVLKATKSEKINIDNRPTNLEKINIKSPNLNKV